MRSHHATHHSAQFKTLELLISGIFHRISSDWIPWKAELQMRACCLFTVYHLSCSVECRCQMQGLCPGIPDIALAQTRCSVNVPAAQERTGSLSLGQRMGSGTTEHSKTGQKNTSIPQFEVHPTTYPVRARAKAFSDIQGLQ